MQRTIVLTLIGADRPGLVGAVSQTVREHGGNWIESRMAHLAGQFAGILCVEVPGEAADGLVEALEAMGEKGLAVTVAGEAGERVPVGDGRLVSLEVVGQDRPGIVAEITRVLASQGVNLEELSTECSSAPWSGETMFRAVAKLGLPEDLSVAALGEGLEAIASDLMVEITLDETPTKA